ncbi:acylglycerol kinase, mitochondrial [Pararge aegeria]|uniref:Acylglycerol kinase, mitochondrial n=1 Tax=Pararge aegeria aegeria TaxID=348720 RepID=A0A8S4S0Y9_9NEOP|nr:acylglycerol kinase, mitochondrial [Pararge aegeria]CAH2241575.1 jg3911 [Pararge aegeria aegeria]
MERIIKIGKTLRNNWKKSVLGAVVLLYGAATAKEKYEISILMQAACKEAVKYGDSVIPMDRNPTLVTVILNPVANKRKAKKDFEKYCEPLLHLAGLQVDVIQTTSEGHAKEIVESLHGTEAIIVAGGDGTLSETVTGLLRRNDEANRFPLGILPLGRTNSLGNTLFPGGEGTDRVKQLIQACMAIIENNTTWKNVMKIEPVANEDEVPSKPIYALTSIEWGAFRDTLARKDKYWIYGPLREYVSYIFNGYKDSICWNCCGTLKYTPPCSGCSNCLRRKPVIKRKWAFFMPTTHQQTLPQTNWASVENPECTITNELCFKTCDFQIKPNVSDGLPMLIVGLGKNNYSYIEFVSDGWRRAKYGDNIPEVVKARTVELQPLDNKPDLVLSIDQEEFEVKPVKITLLPNMVKFFCRSEIKG